MRRIGFASVLVGVLGCSREAPPSPPIDTPESSRNGSIGKLAGHAVVYAAAEGLLVDQKRVAPPAGPSGFDASLVRDGAIGPIIAPLADRLKDGQGSKLLIASATPYRVFFAIGATVAQSDGNPLELAVRSRGQATSLVIRLATRAELVCASTAARPAARAQIQAGNATSAEALFAHPEPLCLAVVASAEGYFVRAGASVLDRTCAAFASDGRAPTFPRIEGRLDAAGLSTCAAALGRVRGAAGSVVVVSASAGVPLGDLVKTLDALDVVGLGTATLGPPV